MNQKVLIVDDEKDICLFVKKALLKFENTTADFFLSPKEALKSLKNNTYDVILLDFKMPELNGFEFIDQLKDAGIFKKTKIILMTAYGDIKMGMDAINKGCFDYLSKPFNIENLIFRIKKAFEHILLNEKVKILSDPITSKFTDFIGDSAAIKKIYKIAYQVADKDTTILIEGETGTGKEILAKSIHKNSNRKDNVFIPVNCGALTETLLENELFGHEKGAFTGAVNKKYGILETADSGTIFLDEINNSSLKVQSSLLRFIETGEFIRVGGNGIIKCNTRILAASNQQLDLLVEENKFREDLYHRLNVVKLTLPPLRDRQSDIPLLVNYFLEMFNKKFSKKTRFYKNTMNYFLQYYWPGNIRQLKNLIQSLVLLDETGTIKPENLPDIIKQQNIFSSDLLPFKKVKEKLISDFEIRYFDNLLKITNGNVSKASELALLNRKHLIDKLKQYKINASNYKASAINKS